MIILPAIDLIQHKAVRLLHGDYSQMTVYSDNPLEVARAFEASGAEYIHTVDLEGAKDGTTPNIDTVSEIAKNTRLFVEIGGGIRNMQTVEKYLACGVKRVILGTAAVKNPSFLEEAVKNFGKSIAVGVDISDGFVAVNGWLEKSELTLFDFCGQLEALGVDNIICTDISKDGAMKGTNREMYASLKERFGINITASGGVSTLDDVKALRQMNLYGAIIGKAYYTGAIKLDEAIEVAK